MPSAEGRWRTREGQVLLLSQMTDSHLQNAINMIERGALKRPGKLSKLKDEQARRMTPVVVIHMPLSTATQPTGRLFRDETD